MNKLTSAKMVLSFIFSIWIINASAQSQEKMYALSLITFAKSTDWPGNNAKVIIGVWEYMPLFSELNELAKTRNINGKPMEIRQVSDESELLACHILFLPSYKQKSFPRILNKIGLDPVLIVTNKKDMVKNGGCIDIILIGGKLNYEINCRSIEKRGLRVANSLKNMGKVVENCQ